MDQQWGNDDESEEIWIEDEDCNIDSVFEQERCGICIDIVVDRGVLDCCDHWFCFACIDNWATITNLCPICKNEFQHITCLPVYDTIRSIILEEHPVSRNEDWSFQGKNNTLSFPAYYISEDAVKCLENDGCKIRSAMQATEDDLSFDSFDTSIACDSCDIWYHAFCVGFNPEFTSEDSWLCPRCINHEVPQNSGAVSLQSFLKYPAPQTAEIGWTVDSSLYGKVSVSVADAGETAVVVSMIEGKQNTDCETSFFDRLDSNMDILIEKSSLHSDIENSETDLQLKGGSCIQVSESSLFFNDYKEHLTNVSDVDTSSECFFDISPEIIDFQPYGALKEATISSFSDDATVNKPRNDITDSQSPPTLQDLPFSLCYPEANEKGMTINALETTSDLVYSDVYMDSPSVSCGTFKANDEPDNKSLNIIGTCSAAPSSADNVVTSCNEDIVVDIFRKNREGCNSTEKPKMNKTCTINMDENNDCIRKREPEIAYPMKKLKLDRKSKTLPTGNQTTFSSLDVSQACSRKNRGASLRCAKQEEAEASDIMSIVQQSDCTSHDMPTEMKAANKSIGKKDSTCGLRVKKIIRRVGEKKESSSAAQELGKEIREVVQHKALKGVGKSGFDEKLLAAFRAAIVRPQTELTNRSKFVHIGEKNPLLMKGKKRENLTKKIYGTASGRRRHAWVRDLGIEFWKHRCKRVEPDKVETLQSVLELLKKATNPHWNSSMERDSQEESKDSILSRVYIADASLFPRKDDIKPLSELSESSQLDTHILEKERSSRNVTKGPLNDDKNSKKNSIQISNNSMQLKANDCDSRGKNIHASCFPGETSNCKVNSFKTAADSMQSSGTSGSKESITTSTEHSCLSDAKTNKKKWALEVLARQTSSKSLNANKGLEDGDLLKGKYPLLAQLPQDMRPVLASARHNKVSASVRQVQLYRITEHYLRRTNLPIIRRTAETELAVADAGNVEKEIFKRSNSKLVYVNLCSQAVSQLANKPESAEENVSNFPNAVLKVTNEVAESTKSDIETDNKPEPAGTNVSGSTLPASEVSIGVLGETIFCPKADGWNNVEEALKMAGLFSDSPPSSPCATKDFNEDESTQENVNEGLNSDAQSNVLHSMDTERDPSKTQNPGQTVVAYDCINVAVKLPFDFSKSLEQQKESGPDNSQAELRMENVLPPSTPERGRCNEPSLEECEGGNKEHPMGQISYKAVEVLNQPMVTGEDKNSISGLKESCILNDAIRVSVTDTKSCNNDPDGCSAHLDETSARKEDSETHSRENTEISPVIFDNIPNEEITILTNEKSDLTISISKKVEAYIKEHIRPLCKSGVITVEQYRWAVGKTLDKVMKFHHKAKNANFLIREGEKVKKLAEQYVESAQQKDLR